MCSGEACMQGELIGLRDVHPVSWTLSDHLGHSVAPAERDDQSTSCCNKKVSFDGPEVALPGASASDLPFGQFRQVVLFVLLGVILCENILHVRVVHAAIIAVLWGNVKLAARVAVGVQAMCLCGNGRPKRDIMILAAPSQRGTTATDETTHLFPRTPRRRVRIPRNVDRTTLPNDAELMGRRPKSLQDMV